MRSKSTQKDFPVRKLASPYLLIGIILLVGLGVAALTYTTILRNQREFTRLYEEKGASLITSVEAGVRADLRSTNSTIRLKLLLDEMANRPEIFFIAITFADGTMMQSTFTEGQVRMKKAFLRRRRELAVDADGHSLIYTANERQVFLAYREFSPLSKQDVWMKLEKEPTLEPMKKFMRLFQRKRPHEAAVSSQPAQRQPVQTQSARTLGTKNLAEDLSAFLENEELEADARQPVIYVGLDARPLRELHRANLVQTVVTSGIVLLLALAGILSLYWAQRAQHSRRKAGRSKAVVQEVMFNLPDGLIVTDAADQIVYMNELSRTLLHCDGEIVAGSDAAQILLPELVPYYIQAKEGELRTEQSLEISTNTIPLLPLGVIGSAITDDRGANIGTVFLMRDLREVHGLQAEVQRKDKLAAIGSLAAGVAHEIRNPLSSIKGGATYLKSQFSEDSAGRRTASIVIEEVERLNRVITDLIGLSRPSDITLKPASLRNILDHCSGLIAQEAELRDVQVTVNVADDLPEVMLDADRFSQVVLNLCLNSLDAMEEGDTLRLSASADDAAVSFLVEDTGEGMDDETRERIFEPYFTTKSHGTGLGLSVVHKIIEAHHGIIRVFSRKGKGTRFVIQLPCTGKG